MIVPVAAVNFNFSGSKSGFDVNVSYIRDKYRTVPGRIMISLCGGRAITYFLLPVPVREGDMPTILFVANS